MRSAFDLGDYTFGEALNGLTLNGGVFECWFKRGDTPIMNGGAYGGNCWFSLL